MQSLKIHMDIDIYSQIDEKQTSIIRCENNKFIVKF